MLKTVEILKRIQKVMVQVTALNKNFDMKRFISDPYAFAYFHQKTIHTCFTAACIMGYFALSKESEFLRRSLRKISDLKKTPADLKTGHWNELWEELEERCDKEFKKPFFGNEIYGSLFKSSCATRISYALDSELFNLKELEPIRFLNIDSPTAQDAVDYLEILIKKLENKK